MWTLEYGVESSSLGYAACGLVHAPGVSGLKVYSCLVFGPKIDPGLCRTTMSSHEDCWSLLIPLSICTIRTIPVPSC